MASSSSTSPASLESKGRKRKSDYEFDFSFGDEGLPRQISKWKVFDLDTLGIYYNNTFATDPTQLYDALNRSENSPFDENPFLKRTLESLKAKLVFDLPPSEEFLRYPLIKASEHIKSLYCNLASLKPSEPDDIINLALSNSTDFTVRVAYLLERLFVRKPITKHLYTGIVAAFARVCFLQDELGNGYNNEMWINNVEVVSVPDLRLKRPVLSFEENPKTQQLTESVVSVVEVKRNTLLKEPVEKRQTPKKSKTDDDGSHILSLLGPSVLGQHGGELLVEWKDSLFKPYMPGLIVYGTKVMMTLLHITEEHVEKLTTNTELDSSEDKATIFYARPLDMLVKNERDVLIETLLKLSFTNRAD